MNLFKKLRILRKSRRIRKIFRRRRTTKVFARRERIVFRRVRRKVTRTYRRVRCKITKKGCFTAGTLISTKDGDIPIEDIEEGDLVRSQDPETGEVALKKVVQTFEKETDTILYIKVAGEVIEATEQHVFYIDGVGWIPASMIEEGDVVVLQSGDKSADKSAVEKIDKVVHNELITVYNFEVEDFHTYFVSDASVLVHNDYSGVRRKGAFRKAKRDAGIYKSQQPYKIGSDYMRTAEHEGSKIILGKNSKPIKTREYYFINDKGKKIIIQDHGAGHLKGGQGPHFNVRPANKKRTGKVEGTKSHYPFNKR